MPRTIIKHWITFPNLLHPCEYELIEKHSKEGSTKHQRLIETEEKVMAFQFQVLNKPTPSGHTIELTHIGKTKPFRGHLDHFQYRKAASYWLMNLLNPPEQKDIKLHKTDLQFQWKPNIPVHPSIGIKKSRYKVLIEDAFRTFQLYATHAQEVQQRFATVRDTRYDFDIALRAGLLTSVKTWNDYHLESFARYKFEGTFEDSNLERCFWMPRYLATSKVDFDRAFQWVFIHAPAKSIFHFRISAMQALWDGDYAEFLKYVRLAPEESYTNLRLPLWFVPFAMAAVEGEVDKARMHLINQSIVDGLGLYTAYTLWAVCCEQYDLHEEAEDARCVAEMACYVPRKPLPDLDKQAKALSDYRCLLEDYMNKVYTCSDLVDKNNVLRKRAQESARRRKEERNEIDEAFDLIKPPNNMYFFEDEDERKLREENIKKLHDKILMLNLECLKLERQLEKRAKGIIEFYGPVFFQHWKQRHYQEMVLHGMNPYEKALQWIWAG